MKQTQPPQQVPLDRVTQTIYARIHAALAPEREQISKGREIAAVLGRLFTMFGDALPSLDLPAYNAMRRDLSDVAFQLRSAERVPFSAATRAMAEQVAAHDLPRLAAIATKLNEEEAPKFFAAFRGPDSPFGHFAVDAKKKTTIRKADFNTAIDQIVNRRLKEFGQLIKEDVAQWLAEQGGGGTIAMDGTSGPRYLLQKGVGGWRLVFDWKDGGLLRDGKGLLYVSYLLKNPPCQPLHGSVLGKNACGDLLIEGQRNLAADDADSFEGQRKARKEWQSVVDDPDSSEPEKKEALGKLEEIEEWARKNLRGTEGNEQKQVRAIRQAIRRLLQSLAKATDERKRPNEAVRAFGEHVDQYLWKPSSRYGGGWSSRVRSGVAGCFTYERPVGVRWMG